MASVIELIEMFESEMPERGERTDDYFAEFDYTTACEHDYDSHTIIHVFLRQQNVKIAREFLEYCFSKEYIQRTSSEFQNLCAKEIQTVHEQGGFTLWLYMLDYVFTPETLRSRFYLQDSMTETFTLFQKLFWGDFNFTIKQIDTIFRIFDAVGFNYTEPSPNAGTDDFLTTAIRSANWYMVECLLKRGAPVTSRVLEVILKDTERKITGLRWTINKCEDEIRSIDSRNECEMPEKQYIRLLDRKHKLQKCIDVYSEIIKTPFLIRRFFNLKYITLDDDGYNVEQNRRLDYDFAEILSEHVNGKFNMNDYSDIQTQYKRYWRIAPTGCINNLIRIFKLLREFFTSDFKAQLLEIYQRGSLLLSIIYPDIHQTLMELFS